ncbi:MAG: hypothetical protein FWH29_06330 [Methanobrevibacter sp.]|nr:hypothetical protein [Methanobrevibacter sp.]
MSLGIGPELEAYSDDISMTAVFIVRTLDKRKELTDELIKRDKSTFKKFIGILKEYIKDGIVEGDSIEDLLRINVDKFLNESIVEYI